MERIASLAALAAVLTLLSPSSALGATDWSWPVRGDVVTKYRNGDDPYAAGQHRGIDVAAPVGAEVVAATGGRVTFAGSVGSSGLALTLRSADGRFDLSHLHLSAVAVREGDDVRQGDRLGAVGVSGRRSVEEPHLHFGVREAGSEHGYRDPLDFLPPPARPAERPEPPVATPQPVPVVSPLPAIPQPAPTSSAVHPAPSPSPLPAPVGTTAGTAVALPVAAIAGYPVVDVVLRGGRTRAEVRPAPATRAGAVNRPRPELSTGHGPSRAPHRLLDLGRAPAPSDRSARSAAPELEPSRPAAGDRATQGFDTGWLAALVGLVAAAACLGRPDTARRAARGGRAVVGGALRPLLGRG